jgi:hypothetical protein
LQKLNSQRKGESAFSTEALQEYGAMSSGVHVPLFPDPST